MYKLKIMAVVYFHRRKDTNEVFYVGIGKTKQRAYRKSQRNTIWNRIVSKTEYSIEIIHNKITWNEACELEKFYINKFGRLNNKTGILSNMTDGGEGVENPSDEVRKKQSKANKGKIVSKKTREIQRQNNIGDKNNQWGKFGVLASFYGGKHTKEARKKISEANKNKKITKEQKENYRLANLGSKNPGSKLTEKEVIEIRKKYKPFIYTKPMLAKEYNISEKNIDLILRRKTWKHI